MWVNKFSFIQEVYKVKAFGTAQIVSNNRYLRAIHYGFLA
jgi:hypothetical protein